MKRVLLLIVLMGTVVIPALAQDAGWIGVAVTDQKDRGVLIRDVEGNSPASRAGLRSNDVIVQYNMQDVVGVLQLTRLIRETPVGRTVEIKVLRDNKEQTFQVTTGAAPASAALQGFRVQMPDRNILSDRIFREFPNLRVTTSMFRSGMQLQSLTPQLRDFFGVRANEGALVASVEAGSQAERAGLKAGDVIISIDGRRVSSPSDVTWQARSDSVTLKVVRDKQEREIKIEESRPTPARRNEI